MRKEWAALAAARYGRMPWWRKWLLDCQANRCWPYHPLVLRKVVDSSGCYYTVPKFAVSYPELAAWVQLDTDKAKLKLKGHWLEGVSWLPLAITIAARTEPATRAEVDRYLQVTATIAGRG